MCKRKTMKAYKERKVIVAPICFRAYARAGSSQELNEPDKYKWWENFDRFDILIIGENASIHFTSYLPRIMFILERTIVSDIPLQMLHKLNPHIMIHLNLSGFHDWNHHLINQIISSSFQNKILMIKKAPLFYFLLKNNIIHQPLLKVSQSILHHLAHDSNSNHTTNKMVSHIRSILIWSIDQNSFLKAKETASSGQYFNVKDSSREE